jgi:biopolymer transport protein TolR
MSLGSGNRGKRRRGVAEINVTPLVDVMLVLLVIFMVTAPTLKEGFSVDIPMADKTDQVPVSDAFMVTVTPEGQVLKPGAGSADQRYEKLSDFVTDLQKYRLAQEQGQKKPVVVIVGDKAAKYERVIQVWNAVRTAGIPQVSLQVDPGTPENVLK